MTTIQLIAGAVAAVATLIYFVWKRYGSTDEELRKLKKEHRQVRKKMRKALRDGRLDDYHDLNLERMSLNRQIKGYVRPG